MNKYNEKITGKNICALCCNNFMNCEQTKIADIRKCGTYLVLKDRYGNKTVGEFIEKEENNG